MLKKLFYHFFDYFCHSFKNKNRKIASNFDKHLTTP